MEAVDYFKPHISIRTNVMFLIVEPAKRSSNAHTDSHQQISPAYIFFRRFRGSAAWASAQNLTKYRAKLVAKLPYSDIKLCGHGANCGVCTTTIKRVSIV
jgi:hypothetical protein